MYASFATTEKTLGEVLGQLGFRLPYNPISSKIMVVSGETQKVMMLIGRYADNGDDCLIKAEVI